MVFSVLVIMDSIKYSQVFVVNAQIILFGMVICVWNLNHVKLDSFMMIKKANVSLLVLIVDRMLNGTELCVAVTMAITLLMANAQNVHQTLNLMVNHVH